jgi:hypothetical protein
MDHRKTGMGEHGEEGSIGKPERDLKRLRIRRADFPDHSRKSAEESGPDHGGVGVERVVLREVALKARNDVVSRQWTAVVEADAVAKKEGPDEAIL